MSDRCVGQHPCFHNGPKEHGRIHLPVARSCNIKCAYCTPTVDPCYHGCKPGVSAAILTPQQALERVDWAVQADPSFLVVGVSGPGEPLLAEETFETFSLVKEKYPKLLRCVSTNGLLLEQNIDRLAELVDTLTVTINALTVQTAKRIYEHIGGQRTDEAYKAFLDAQWRGVEQSIAHGLTTKINTVYVKGRNEDELEEIAKTAAALGVTIHNILQVIPFGSVVQEEVPDMAEMERARYLCGRHLEQFITCQRCRADMFQRGCGC